MEHLNELKQKLIAKLSELVALLIQAEAAYPDTEAFGVSAPLLDGIQTVREDLEWRIGVLTTATSVEDMQVYSMPAVPGAGDLDQVGLTMTEEGPVRILMHECRSLGLDVYDCATELSGEPR